MNFTFSFSFSKNNDFVFHPTHPIYSYTGEPAKAESAKSEPSQKPAKTNPSKQPVVPVRNRLFSLPLELVQKIFEYDNTCRKYYDEIILCKTEETNERSRLAKERNHFHFYQMILNNRVFMEGGHRKKYCEMISCSIRTSWFDDNNPLELPFPYDLTYLNSRLIPRVNVQKNIYEYNGQTFYFIRCEMEIRKFVKGLYNFLGEPEEEEFEIFFYTNWEDEEQVISILPTNGGANDYLDEIVQYGQYKKMMIMGEAIDDYNNLILFADKNAEGKDMVYIQVDMDVFAMEDDMIDYMGFVSYAVVQRRLRDIYEMRVHEVVQVVKKYLATTPVV